MASLTYLKQLLKKKSNSGTLITKHLITFTEGYLASDLTPFLPAVIGWLDLVSFTFGLIWISAWNSR